MAMKIVISDPKTRKAYTVSKEEPYFVGKKIGEIVDLGVLGINELQGYKAVITGGTDKDGFPMEPTLEGTKRKAIMKKVKGKKDVKKKKTVKGNTVDENIALLNVKVVEYGNVPLEEIFGKKEGDNKDAQEEKK